MKGSDSEGLEGRSERGGPVSGVQGPKPCRSLGEWEQMGGAHAEFIVGLLPPTKGLAPDLGWLEPS